ncbi:MAG TPA: hypothetical protein VGO61_18390 [Steroidobacteraceae bacterium]|jgi:hypothetical protein|nr:hypothetical protein [Steroidobacteraceae bacterium]
MLYFLNSPASPRQVSPPPQRRRAIIIGAGPTGMSAAYHLGEHSLLLEQRTSLEDFHDRSNHRSMGAARIRSVGREDGGADGERPGTSCAERKALFISCSSTGKAFADEQALIHVARWQPPELQATTIDEDRCGTPGAPALLPLLRGELRLGARVVRVSPSQHMVELAGGARFVYDKLLSTISLSSLAGMVMHEIPPHVRRDESLRYWLSEYDIELGDRGTQVSRGDLDDFVAGRRIAGQIGRALAAKFQNAGPAISRGARLFEPRVVPRAMPGAGAPAAQ